MRDRSVTSVRYDDLKPAGEQTFQERLERLRAVKVLMPGVGGKRELIVYGKFEHVRNVWELHLHGAIGFANRRAVLLAKSVSDFMRFVEGLHSPNENKMSEGWWKARVGNS